MEVHEDPQEHSFPLGSRPRGCFTEHPGDLIRFVPDSELVKTLADGTAFSLVIDNA